MIYLSDAIRLGAMMKPQGGSGTGTRHHSETCAFGAARDAVASDDRVDQLWPWLGRLRVFVCPECKQSDAGEPWVFGIIPHLNNDHRWTRERIADWVEEQEIDLGVRPQPEVVESETVEEMVVR